MDLSESLSLIRPVVDFPKPGILFQDITPALSNPKAFASLVSELAKYAIDVEYVVGLEARGFILASAIATQKGLGFVPIRKSGKLPFTTHARAYGLEYGSDVLEIHTDAVPSGAKVLLIDDVLATGGSIGAGLELLHEVGAVVERVAVLMEIPSLGGREKLLTTFPSIKIHSLLSI
jgi:adenine phosphoribosyltransferase